MTWNKVLWTFGLRDSCWCSFPNVNVRPIKFPAIFQNQFSMQDWFPSFPTYFTKENKRWCDIASLTFFNSGLFPLSFLSLDGAPATNPSSPQKYHQAHEQNYGKIGISVCASLRYVKEIFCTVVFFINLSRTTTRTTRKHRPQVRKRGKGSWEGKLLLLLGISGAEETGGKGYVGDGVRIGSCVFFFS